VCYITAANGVGRSIGSCTTYSLRDLGDGVQAADVDLKLASHMSELAWLSNPEHPAVQQLVLDAFKARILDPESNTQEMLAYLDRMTEARQRQLTTE
jgi:hypothetical protein